MRKDQSGAIVVETTISFTLFVLFVTSILSLINVVVIQARVHYAMTQTVQAVSMYEYCLHLTGLEDDFMSTAEKASKTRVEVNEFKNNVGDVLDGISNIAGSDSISSAYASAQSSYESGQKAYTQVEAWGDTLVNEPEEMISKLLTLGLDSASRAAFSAMAEPIIYRYLSNGTMSGEEYLEQMGVINFDVDSSKSTILSEDGEVILVVTYEVDFSFGALPLPFDTLTFEQTAASKVWLGGAGKGYSP